jgi:hypothetical protein
LSSTRTRWRFGSNRRFEATIEWERWLPNEGFFPQIAQIFDIAAGSVADADREGEAGQARALARRRANRSAISSAERTASAAFGIRASACSIPAS